MKAETNQVLKRVTDSLIAVDKKGGSSKKYFNAIKGDITRIEDQGAVAQILLNLQKIMDDDTGQQFMQTSNYGPFVQEFWPVVAAYYPEFPLKDLISIQPMDKDIAYLFFTRLLTGTSKSSTANGEIVETATGRRVLKGKYPTGEITGETLLLADFQFDGVAKESIAAMAYYPLTIAGQTIKKYLLKLTSTNANLNGTHKVISTVNGFVNFSKNAVDITATLEIASGQLTVKEAANAAATSISEALVNYVWNIESADQTQVPTIVEDIIMLPMQAIPRALAMKWTIFSEYSKKAQFGQDIRTSTTKRILDLLYYYQCRYILDEMYDYAEGTVNPVQITLPTANITVEAKAQVVLEALNEVGNTIASNVGRMQGNRIVFGNTMKSFVESLPNTIYQAEPEGDGYIGPRKLGKFGNYMCFYDPDRAAAEGFMTYRGQDWCDAVYYVGEFMPMIPTDAVTLGVNVRAAFCSMEAYEYHKKNGVVQLTFVKA